MLIDRRGQVRGQAAVATPFHGGEMSVDGLVGAVSRVTGALGDGCRRVAAVGIAGMAESGAPMDRDGRPQAPIIVWHDPRGAEVVGRLQRHFGDDLDRWIGQRLRTVSTVAKLGWLVDHGVGPLRCWLGVPELVLHALTGTRVTEFSLAARTGAYHVGERRYLSDVIEALGVAPEAFPVVGAAGDVMGRISGSGAAWSALPSGIPVTVAGHDHLAGLAGSGSGPEDVVNSVGTAETVIAGVAVMPDADRARSLGVAVTVMPGGKRWALLASSVRSGIVVEAVARALGRSAEELDQAAVGAARVPIGPGLVSAAVRGEPVELPSAPPGAIWNGVLDALAARTWDAVDRVELAAGDRTEPGDPVAGVAGRGLVVFGGGSRSRPWLQAKAAARPETPVWRSGASEAVAQGAALYAGVAARWWPAPLAGPRTPLERVTTW